nr:nuclear speckle splicing regulatory protein 1-like [Ipomoea batatas]
MKKSGYGLQLRAPPSQQKKQPSRPPLPTALGFGDGDDDDVEKEISRQASKNKALRDIEEQHKKALEEDPSVFDYDGVYDDMKMKAVQPRAQDREERKPKYIQQLINKAKQREREHEIIYERKLAKERTKDDHLFADKDKFLTSAYKKKLQEQEKWMQEERLRELREAKEDVTKKTDISDFYFSLASNVAFGGGESKINKPEKQHEEEVAIQPPKEIPSSSTVPRDMSREIKRQEIESSPSPKERSQQAADTRPISIASSEEKATTAPAADDGPAVNEALINDQPRQEHHKRSGDALAAAKERFMARKRAKEESRLGIRHLLIESESKPAMDCMRGITRGNMSSNNIIVRSLEMLKEFVSVHMRHIYREQNRIADALVKKVLSHNMGLIAIETIPNELKDAVREDQIGVRFSRRVPAGTEDCVN